MGSMVFCVRSQIKFWDGIGVIRMGRPIFRALRYRRSKFTNGQARRAVMEKRSKKNFMVNDFYGLCQVHDSKRDVKNTL